MKILSLDIAKKRTGHSLVNEDKVLSYGNIDCPKAFIKIKNNEAEFSRVLLWYALKVKLLCKNYLPDAVIMEDLNCEYVIVAKTMIPFQVAARFGCLLYNSHCYIDTVHNATVKSVWGIPKGKKFTPQKYINLAASLKPKVKKPLKLMMIDKVNEKYGLSLSYYEDDEADSIAIAHTYIERM